MDHVYISHFEWLNLTLPMQKRRITRLNNGFSKTAEHYAAMQGILFCWYKWCRKHETIKMTPAQASGLADKTVVNSAVTGAGSLSEGEELLLKLLGWVIGFAFLGIILVLMLMHHQRWRFSLSLIMVLVTLVAIETASWVALFRMAEESERQTRLKIELEIQQHKR